MTNHPPTPPPSSPSTQAQRRQRNALIGLGVGSGIVLLIGIIAAVLTRDPGSATVPTTFSTVVTTTSTVPPATTAATTSTTATSTTLPAPVPAVADAGPDLVVASGEVVTLSALDATEGADDESIVWRQTVGPDVTSGVGALGGRVVSFGAPADVVTLEFELVVSSGDPAATSPEAVDAIVVRVFEDADRLLFVDGERGDDTAIGSMEVPLRSIGAAALMADGRDIYVRSVGTYTEQATVRLGPGTSLYGGFDTDWKRDRSQRVRLDGAAVAVVVEGDVDRTIGSIELTAADADPGGRSIGIRIIDGETVTVADSRVLAGEGGAGTGEAGAAVSAGVLAVQTGEVRIERSTVNASDGGRGVDGASFDSDAAVGEAGDDAAAGEAGDGAAGDGLRVGGDGGRGGFTSDGEDASEPGGGAGGTAAVSDGEPGRGGLGGAGGVGGDGGQGLFDGDVAAPVGASGSIGESGQSGNGGAGGGGGFGPLIVRGGGGGGGGGGADVGSGGAAGGGGGGSIGVWAVDVDRVVIDESLVAAGRGGAGGNGGAAERGGAGGLGGEGAEGSNGFIVGDGGDGGDGGGAGGGGAGGGGGRGGGGAGGPSYGMLTSGVDDVEVRASTIRGGAGGSGADGGLGGTAGGDGNDGSGRRGGDGGSAGIGDAAEQGAGASGGSSYGWFDVDGASQTFDEAAFIEGNAGPGGAGSSRGDDGVQTAANVDAE
jgi:hypothetical protein